MLIRVSDFTSLAAAVTGLGGEMPKSVMDVLAGVETFHKAATGGGGDPQLSMRAAIRGEAVTVEGARDLLMSMAVAQLAGPRIAEYLNALEYEAIQLMQELLRGDAGDEMMDSLRPIADQAIAGIQAANAHFGPDTTPAQVLEMGDEAIDAWRGTGAHAQVLESILNGVVRPLARDLYLLPPELLTDGMMRNVAVWLINPARAYDIDDFKGELNRPTSLAGVPFMGPIDPVAPGRRWLALHQVTGIHLNSPRQAVAILEGLAEVENKAERERAAKNKEMTRKYREAAAPGKTKITVRS
jgi:hypothetical protein